MTPDNNETVVNGDKEQRVFREDELKEEKEIWTEILGYTPPEVAQIHLRPSDQIKFQTNFWVAPGTPGDRIIVFVSTPAQQEKNLVDLYMITLNPGMIPFILFLKKDVSCDEEKICAEYEKGSVAIDKYLTSRIDGSFPRNADGSEEAYPSYGSCAENMVWDYRAERDFDDFPYDYEVGILVEYGLIVDGRPTAEKTPKEMNLLACENASRALRRKYSASPPQDIEAQAKVWEEIEVVQDALDKMLNPIMDLQDRLNEFTMAIGLVDEVPQDEKDAIDVALDEGRDPAELYAEGGPFAQRYDDNGVRVLGENDQPLPDK